MRALPALSASAQPSARGDLRVLLIGAGIGHLLALEEASRKGLPKVQITLVTPQQTHIDPRRLPDLLSGQCGAPDCALPLEALVHRSGAHWRVAQAASVDARARSVTLQDGTLLPYDWLSVEGIPPPDPDTLEAALPGARAHGLALQPLHEFVPRWTAWARQAGTRAQRLAVLGANATAAECALALRRGFPTSAITLLCGSQPPGAELNASARRKLLSALKANRITVLPVSASALRKGAVELGPHSSLACDLALIALDPPPGHWQEAARKAAPLPRWVRSGARHAIVSWGRWSAQGWLVWWLSRWLQQRQWRRWSQDARGQP